MQTAFTATSVSIVHWDSQNWNCRACQVFNEQCAETIGVRTQFLNMHVLQWFQGWLWLKIYRATLGHIDVSNHSYWGQSFWTRWHVVAARYVCPKNCNCDSYKANLSKRRLLPRGVISNMPGVCYWIPLPFWTASISGALDHRISRGKQKTPDQSCCFMSMCHFMRSKWFCHVLPFFLWLFLLGRLGKHVLAGCSFKPY